MRWAGRDLRSMTAGERGNLYSACEAQAGNETAPTEARMWALGMLSKLQAAGPVTLSDAPGGHRSRARQAPPAPSRTPGPGADHRTVEQRVADAKEALYGHSGPDPYGRTDPRPLAQRIEDAKSFLTIPKAGTVRK